MTPRSRPYSQDSHQSGFALVIALSLMAFVVLLLLSMTALLQVETRAAESTLQTLQARESARLALMLAIGELQKHAGPDQRVTARADILGDGNFAPEARFWTGVWDTTDPTATPTWLVSGANVDPNSLSAETMQLVGSGSAGSDPTQYVYAPTLEVLDANGAVSDEIAWWISDEGVKASVALTDDSENLSDLFFNDFSTTGLTFDEQRQILKQLGLRRTNLNVFYGTDTKLAPSEVADIREPSIENEVITANQSLRRITNATQTALMDGIDAGEASSTYHDTTYLSKAVLIDTERGGLKRDLMDRSFSDTTSSLKVDDALRKFLWESSPNPAGDIAISGLETSAFADLIDGDAVTTTPVIITECSLYFAVSGQSKNSKTARAFLRFEAEMWSPYGFRHNFIDSSGSGTPELTVEFTGLPDITLKFFDKDTGSFTNSTSLSFDDIDPKFELNFSDTHKSGEIRKLAGQWPINASSNKRNFYYTNQWSWTVDDPSYNKLHRNISFPDGDSINYSAAKSDVTLIIRNADNEILQRIENIPIGNISTDFSYYEGTPSTMSVSDAPIAFQYRLYDSVAELESWFTEIDLRSSSLDLDDSSILENVDVNDSDGDDYGDADLPSAAAFSNLDFFHGQQNNNFFRLFDLPATIPYSLGVLQHLQIKGARPFSIGNDWGADYNSIFDQYFISGIPQNAAASHWSHHTPSPSENPLPNPFISVTNRGRAQSLSNLQTKDSARYLHQTGAFNFNSTSQLAWEALLGANDIFDWDYYINRGTSTETTEHRLNVESAFFRLPFSGHLRSKSFTNWKFPFESYEDEMSLSDDYPMLADDERDLIFKNGDGVSSGSEWKPSASLGHRELSRSHITALATNIINKLKERSQPFVSSKEFINSGILQDAIDHTSINTIVSGTDYTNAEIDERIPRNATSFLSQADIISALSPGLHSRSDTFIIRAGSTTLNPITGKENGNVVCEALVQRLPELSNNDAANEMNNAQGFGRKFIVLDIRWLNSSQL